MVDLRDHIRRRIVRLADPTDNSELTWLVPGTEVWVVDSVLFRLVTDATVATRVVRLTADDQSTTYFRSVAAATQIVSLTRDYTAFRGNAGAAQTDTIVPIAFPDGGLVLQPGHRLRTSTAAITTGDRLSAGAAMVRAFPTGPRVTPLPDIDLVAEPRDGLGSGLPSYLTP